MASGLRRHAILALGLAVWLGACGGSPSSPPPPSGGVGAVAGVARVEAGTVQVASSGLPTRGERVARRRRYVADEILVRFRPGVAEQEVRAAHAQVGGRVVRVIPRIGVHVVKLPAGTNPEGALASYRTSRWVQWAERNAYLYAAAAPNDPLYASHQWHYPLIRLPQAWDVVTGSPLIVAVVDTGVRFDHPDLEGLGVGGWDFVDGDADASDPGCPVVDPTEPSHGTHVAGTVAARTNNGVGTAGVTWGGAAGVRIMSVRVLGEDVPGGECGVGTLAAVAQGIVFAADNGAKVINLSLGGDSPSLTLEAAVNYAYGQGAVLVAAAGNEAGPVSYPAAYPAVVAVAAVACDLSRAPYSNFGPEVELAAPGGAATPNCSSASPQGWVWSPSWSPASGHGYWGFRGTSMATPHVSGLAALLMARGVTSPSEVRQRLRQTATDLGSPGRDDLFGWGLVDAAAAVGASNPAATMRAFVGSASGSTVLRQSSLVPVGPDGLFTVTDAPSGVRSVFVWQDFNTNGLVDPNDLWGRTGGVTVVAGQTTAGVVVSVRRYTGPSVSVSAP